MGVVVEIQDSDSDIVEIQWADFCYEGIYEPELELSILSSAKELELEPYSSEANKSTLI